MDTLAALAPTPLTIVQVVTLCSLEQAAAVCAPKVWPLFQVRDIFTVIADVPDMFCLKESPNPHRMPGRATMVDIPDIPRGFLLTDQPFLQAGTMAFSDMPEYYPEYPLLGPSRSLRRIFRKSTFLQKLALSAVAFWTLVPALTVTLRLTLDAIIHITAGVSIASSASISPLRSAEDVAAAYWISAYYRRLMLGMVLFSGLNLLGSLAQSESSMLDGVAVWGPLALTASLCVVPVLIESIHSPGPRAGLVADVIGL
ncbi:hypothetical protein B0T22DRAFT_476191 [Podospora appendiculata]|uniref:Uncharacterized protein n=1 Tax=Podospora appendiculata TaxID=314037 RepID=A0AAE0XH21_9PEZI|nr:hypothetical protein B0T22DRAFT_476191 [Podospora appendiculata]